MSSFLNEVNQNAINDHANDSKADCFWQETVDHLNLLDTSIRRERNI